MNFLYKRPLFAFCFAFVVGSAFFFCFSKPLLLIFIAALLLLLLFFLIFRRRNASAMLLTIGFLFAAVFSLFMLHYRYSHLEAYDEAKAEITFTVLEITEKNEENEIISIRANIESINGSQEQVTGHILFENGVALSVGDRFDARGTLSYLKREDNEYLFAAGNRVTFTVLLANRIGTDPLLYTLSAQRQALDERIRSAGDGDSAALLAAILFGYRDNLSEKVNINFRQTGFTHAIAVSGLNLTILVGVVFFILGLLHIPHALRNITSIVFAILYTALSGFSPSVVRAAFMTSVLLLSRLLKRPHDPPTTLFFSAAILLLFDPSLALNASYLLSVMATFGLLFVGALLTKESTTPKSLLGRILHIFFSKEGFLLSLGAIAATLFITAVLFGEFSVLSPLSTALLSPLVTVILWLAIPLVIFPESFIGAIADTVSEAILFCIDLLAEIPYTKISLSYPLIVPILFLLSAITVILLFGKKRKRITIVFPLLLMTATVFGASLIHNTAVLQKEPITYVASNSAEATVYLSDDVSILFDTSGSQNALTRTALSILSSSYVTELSAYMVTDYTASLPNTLALVGGRVKTRRCLLPLPQSEEEACIAEKTRAVADRYGIAYTFYANGDTVAVGDVSIEAYRAHSEKGEILYSLYTQSGILTYVSSGFHLYGDIKAANAAVFKSSCVIIGAYNTKAPTHIPYSVDKEALKRVIWADKRVTEWRRPENADILKAIPVVFGPAEDSFSLKELS